MFRAPSFYLVALYVSFSTGYASAGDSQTISKWCNSDGSGERYTTAAYAPKGYHQCGGLQMEAYCDAEGRKFFGRPGTQPYGYFDCGRGPRIILKRIDPHLPTTPKDFIASAVSRENDLLQSVPELCEAASPATLEGLESILSAARSSDESSLIRMILEGYVGYLEQLELVGAQK